MTFLSEELILQKTKSERLESVRNLNVWGCALEDLSILKKCPNLQTCVVSKNKVRSLAFFAESKNLRELYVRKNEIDDMGELAYLQGLRNLTVLQLDGNPVVQRESGAGGDAAHYRYKVIAMLPQLNRLDNSEVTSEERDEAERLYSQTKAVEVIAGPNGYKKAAAIPTLKINSGMKPPLQPANVQPYAQRHPSSPRINVVPDPSPRAPAVQGAGSANVLNAVLLLARELTLDGLLTLKTEVDYRFQQAAQRQSPR